MNRTTLSLVAALVLTGTVAITLACYIALLPPRAEATRPEPVLPATVASHCDRLCQGADTITAEIHFTVEGTSPTGYTCICLTDTIPVDLE